jgi:hypothetical protein
VKVALDTKLGVAVGTADVGLGVSPAPIVGVSVGAAVTLRSGVGVIVDGVSVSAGGEPVAVTVTVASGVA